jgi:hypothetical protein
VSLRGRLMAKLADPMPLGEAIAETTEVLQPEESK